MPILVLSMRTVTLSCKRNDLSVDTVCSGRYLMIVLQKGIADVKGVDVVLPIGGERVVLLMQLLACRSLSQDR